MGVAAERAAKPTLDRSEDRKHSAPSTMGGETTQRTPSRSSAMAVQKGGRRDSTVTPPVMPFANPWIASAMRLD